MLSKMRFRRNHRQLSGNYSTMRSFVARISTCTVALASLACNSPVSVERPVFIQGRAVATAGDSLYAAAAPGGPLVVFHPDGHADSLGGGVLHDPLTVQWDAGAWWVSDLVDGAPSVVRITPDGSTRRIPLAGTAVQPHQFAVLPDGRLIVEGSERRLVAVRDDSVTTFAVVPASERPSLVIGASGGVLHAVPDAQVTLYNAFGHERWRLEWPWVETAHVSAIATDAVGRIHLLSGVADEGTFLVYSLDPSTGEVVRWSEADSTATFTVDRLGKVTPAAGGRWHF